MNGHFRSEELFSPRANMNDPIRYASCCCSRKPMRGHFLTRVSQTSPPPPQSYTKEKSPGVENSLKKSFNERIRSRIPLNLLLSINYFYRFLTSSYRQTAIQAFGGHQNVHFHSGVKLRANVKARRVAHSSVFIRFHLFNDIFNRNGCRCTKRHVRSRLAASLSRIFFHYPSLLIRSRETVFKS